MYTSLNKNLDSSPVENQFKKTDGSEFSHTKVLILGAVCLSIIGIILTSKISGEQKINIANEYELSVVSGKTEDQLTAEKKIIEALNKAQLASLGSLASSSNPFDPSPKDTLSDRFSKDIFAAYLKYEQDGIVPDGDAIVNSFQYLDISDVNKNTYNLSNLNIFVPTSSAEIKNYGNVYAKIFLETTGPVDKDTAKYLGNINNMIPIYKALGQNLLKIPVPSAVANEHLELINQYLKQADAFVLVSGEIKDPVKALLGLKVVQEGVNSQTEMYTHIKAYLNNNGILYDKSESGTFWNTGTSTNSLTLN